MSCICSHVLSCAAAAETLDRLNDMTEQEPRTGVGSIGVVCMHTSPLEQPGVGDAGGMNVYVLNTSRALARRGIAVEIFTRATRISQHAVVEVEPNLRVHHIIAGPFEGLDKEMLSTQVLPFATGVLAAIRDHHLTLDVLHAHYWLSGQVGWLLRDLLGVPLAFTGHTLAAVKNSSLASGDAPESEARRIAEQQLVDISDALVANTDREADDLAGHYDAERQRIAVVGPGVDIELFSPGTGRATEQARRELGVPLHAQLVAFAGRLQKLKAPDVFLRAFAELAATDESGCLRGLVVGGPSGNAHARPEDLQQLAADLGIASRIRFLPPRPPEELIQVYRAADIIAVPSHNESFGLVAIEAQACGTPVVAARVGGLPIAVADGVTGDLVDSHDPSAWAEVLRALLDDDERRIAYSHAAVQHAAGFSWEHTVDGLLATYAEMLQRDTRPTDPHDRRGG